MVLEGFGVTEVTAKLTALSRQLSAISYQLGTSPALVFESYLKAES